MTTNHNYQDLRDDVRAGLQERIEQLADECFGDVNKALSKRHERRYGNHGSMSVITAARGGKEIGFFYSHEEGATNTKMRGGVLTLIQNHPSYDNSGPVNFGAKWLGLDLAAYQGKIRYARAKKKAASQDNAETRQSPKDEPKTDAEAILEAIGIVDEAEPITRHSPVSSYLNARGIVMPPPGDAFRVLRQGERGYPALVAIVRDKGGDIVGCQCIHTDGPKKAPLTVPKRSCGRPGMGAIKLPGKAPLILCEGPENGLSIWQSTGQEVWIYPGISNLKHFEPDPEEHPEVTIARDGKDKPGSKAEKALKAVVAGLSGKILVRIAEPPQGLDFNDYHRERGDHAVENAVFSAKAIKLRGKDLTEYLSQFLGENDAANAERFCQRYHRDFIFNPALGGWYAWDGKRYVKDDRERRVRAMKRTASSIKKEVEEFKPYPDEKDEDFVKRKAQRIKWSVNSGNKTRIFAALELAQEMCYVDEKELDTNPYLLNCANGTVDMRNGSIKSHDKADMITKLIPVNYDKHADCPEWKKFLVDVFAINEEADIDPDDDPEGALQRALGYSFSGLTREKNLYVLHGLTNTGKSKFSNIILTLAGDYSKSTKSDAFMIKEGRNDNTLNEIAALRGARFISASELEKSARLSEALVKRMTGDDPIVCRFLFKEFFEYRPVGTIWMHTNHKPEVTGTDDAIWNRMMIINFMTRFWKQDDPDRPVGARVQDPQLEERLKAELPGILAWIVEGFQRYQSVGLRPAARWIEAARDYRKEQDVIGNFLDECCRVGENYQCSMADLYTAYKVWMDENGHRALSKKKFAQSLGERGFEEKRTKSARLRLGLSLQDEMQDKVTFTPHRYS